MERNPYAPEFNDLPPTLAIFPLGGVLLLPGGSLPLNIFEKRYLAMVESAMAGSRLIGMIQPRQTIGCAGKITEFSETTDGRYLITLSGLLRFRVAEELASISGFRQVRADWNAYEDDLNIKKCLEVDRTRLRALLRHYFAKEGMDCDWNAIENAPDGKLITCLSMACPLDGAQKQMLLEAECGKTRAKLFMEMLEIAICDGECDGNH